MKYSFLETTEAGENSIAGGRITIYREPDVEKPCSLGLGFAYGLLDGNFDAGVMLDCDYKQVLTIRGHWGPGFSEILWPVLQWYQPFVVGHQIGLPVLRSLLDRGYGWMYFDRAENKIGRPIKDTLGYALDADTIIPGLQALVAPRNADGSLGASKLEIYDGELHSQLSRFGYQRRTQSVPLEGARDDQYRMGAPLGEHEDLVRACAYSAKGIEWLPHYERPEIPLDPRSIAAIIGWQPSPYKPPETAGARERWGNVRER